MSHSDFHFKHVLDRTSTLARDLAGALESSEDPKVEDLAQDLDPVLSELEGDESPALTLAFVGQYNGGKSTTLSALTGREDIPIDADVCTDRITAYDWKGIRILDTPGIHAGYPAHDEMTYAALDRADLLVFTITNELFDPIVGKHFRDLAFDRHKAREMMLVVNKMGQDPGTPADKIPDIEVVTAPLNHADFRAVFIDALSYLEAIATDDDEEKGDLLEIANLDDLVGGLDRFVQDRGLTGRVTTPLFTLRRIADQARAYASVDFPEERAALELLHRKRRILLESRARVRTHMAGLLAQATADIIRGGDEVAESIEPGTTEADVTSRHERAQHHAEKRCEQLAHDARGCLEGEIEELQRQLTALQNGTLAQDLQQQIAGLLESGEGTDPEGSGPTWDPTTAASIAQWPTQAQRIGRVAGNIGTHAVRWASGPLAESARIGTATATRGSQAHQTVYAVGKFFGVKFKPWGAVKVARALGNAGRVIAAVGGVLAVVAQIAEDHQNEKQRVQLRDARVAVRSAYRDSALAVEVSFRDQLQQFEQDFYEVELQAVANQADELTQRRGTRSSEAGRFDEIARSATELIESVHTA